MQKNAGKKKEKCKNCEGKGTLKKGNKVVRNCEGKGTLKKGNKVVRCQRCDGTGIKR